MDQFQSILTEQRISSSKTKKAMRELIHELYTQLQSISSASWAFYMPSKPSDVQAVLLLYPLLRNATNLYDGADGVQVRVTDILDKLAKALPTYFIENTGLDYRELERTCRYDTHIDFGVLDTDEFLALAGNIGQLPLEFPIALTVSSPFYYSAHPTTIQRELQATNLHNIIMGLPTISYIEHLRSLRPLDTLPALLVDGWRNSTDSSTSLSVPSDTPATMSEALDDLNKSTATILAMG